MLSSENNFSKLYRPFWLILIVFALCIGVSFFKNSFSIFGFEMKEINFLTDFLETSSSKKTIEKPVLKTRTAADSLHYYGVEFENFYPQKNNLFANFIDKLNDIKKKKKKIRIGWFGDSMVEGDLFVKNLRNYLQNEFGGNGVGFVPITSVTGNFRQTIFTLNSGDWQTVSMLKKGQQHLPLGIAGEAFIPSKSSWISFSTVNQPHLNFFQHAELFLYNPTSIATIDVYIDNAPVKHTTVAALTNLQKIVLADSAAFKTIKIVFNADSTLFAYGLNFDNSTGVYVDNFGLRGSSGVAMGTMQPASLLNDWSNLLPYDLLIYEYGLNIVSPKTDNYSWFEKSFPKSIDKIKTAYPSSSMLLLSIGDRATHENGEYKTMPQVPIFIDIQKKICEAEQIAFWNMYDAMGGEGSMVDWVKAKPSLANKDYTHINNNGGEVLGKKLFDAILFETKKRKLNL
jgi:hypothetical protein